MERTLTAAAGPSPCDPYYRHAFTMRPPKKVRPFSFLNYYSGAAADEPLKRGSISRNHRDETRLRGCWFRGAAFSI